MTLINWTRQPPQNKLDFPLDFLDCLVGTSSPIQLQLTEAPCSGGCHMEQTWSDPSTKKWHPNEPLEIQRKVEGLSRKNDIQHNKSKQRVNPHANSVQLLRWICEVLNATNLSMSSGKIRTQGSITMKIPIWSIPSIEVKPVGPNPAAWYKNWDVSGASQIRYTKTKPKQVLQLETLFKGICVENHSHIFEALQTKTRGLLKQPESRQRAQPQWTVGYWTLKLSSFPGWFLKILFSLASEFHCL